MKTILNTDYLNSFLSLATSEFGEKLDFSNISTEGYAGVIALNENSVDIYITLDNYQVYNTDLSDEENKMLDAFISYVQREMRDQEDYSQNVKITEKSLLI